MDGGLWINIKTEIFNRLKLYEILDKVFIIGTWIIFKNYLC